MIDSRYDEDLIENVFFQILKSDYEDVIQRSIKEGWVICIPRADSFIRSSLTEDDFLSHILVPNDELPASHYRTLNGRQAIVSNKVITVEDENIASSLSTHIIFEEIFYTEDLKRYKVWCTEYPLTRNTFQFDNEVGGFNSVSTLRDCIDLLWTESMGKEVLEHLDAIIQEFLLKNNLEIIWSLQKQKDVVCTLYAKCLQTCLRDMRLRERTSRNKYLLDNIKICVESYMHHGIYSKLFASISVCMAYDDSSLNKIVRNLSDIQLRDLNIRNEFYDTIPCAKRELAKINGYSTVLGKINCLNNTLMEISKCNKFNKVQIKYLCTDDILPVFVFLVLKTSVPNWIANLAFLKQFQFSTITIADDSQFLLATLEAAIEHIRSGVLLGPAEPESQLTTQIVVNKNGTRSLSYDNNSNIVHLFEQVKLGNYDQVKDILQKSKLEECVRPDTRELCHPLCSCDKCERLLSHNFYSTTATVHSCDDRGFTALHVACMYGRPKIVELLLEYNANIQCCDYSGATPLHYAAMRGHQNALLLLLHSGAAINAADTEKNTPLHFCCNNGHEPCVKAMLYFSEHRLNGLDVNYTNALGNSPLHYAARWGYEQIVEILLEYGADPTIENKHRKTPLDCAHNLKICQLIKKTKRNTKEKTTKMILFKMENDTKSELDFSDETNMLVSSVKEGVKPRNIQDMKKAELLLRAVAYGDVPLICFYLGLHVPDDVITDRPNTQSLCHPLCRCENCEFAQNAINASSHDTQDINVCNSEGFTALHIASLHGRTEIVRLLLANGACPNLVTRKGLTALHLACQSQRHQIIRLLLQCEECDVNIQDARGNSALHYACYSKDQRILEDLVARNINVHLRNLNGKTAINETEEKMLFALVKVMKTGRIA